MDLQVVPVEWAMVYNVNPHDPIGYVRRVHNGFRARLDYEDLGVHDTGDLAAEAVWARYVQKAHVDHELASRTHGSAERH